MAVDVHPAKLEEAKRLGASEALLEAPAGRVDVAVEAVGRPETAAAALKMVRDGGRVIWVGVAPAGRAAEVEINRVVRRGLTIKGSFGCRVRADMPELLRLAGGGRVKPGTSISRRLRLDEVNAAYAALECGEILGRAIVVL